MIIKVSNRLHWRDGKIGHLVFDGIWFLRDNRGIRNEVDQGWADKTMTAEENQLGRTTYFPGEEVEAHTVTLPVRLWNRVRKPYSVGLARVIETGLKTG